MANKKTPATKSTSEDLEHFKIHHSYSGVDYIVTASCKFEALTLLYNKLKSENEDVSTIEDLDIDVEEIAEDYDFSLCKLI